MSAAPTLPPNILLAYAQMAKEAYGPLPIASATATLPRRHRFPNRADVSAGNAEASLHFNRSAKTALLIFRGTDSKDDWTSENGRVKPRLMTLRDQTGVVREFQVHTGFLDACVDVALRVNDELADSHEGMKDWSFTVVGHSSGAARAQLAVPCLQKFEANVQTVIGFCPPRVQHVTSPDNLEDLVNPNGSKPDVFLVRAEGDPVSDTPASLYGLGRIFRVGYRHRWPQSWLTADGRYVAELSTTDRVIGWLTNLAKHVFAIATTPSTAAVSSILAATAIGPFLPLLLVLSKTARGMIGAHSMERSIITRIRRSSVYQAAKGSA